MKELLCALLLAPALFAAEPDFSSLQVEPLPFPTTPTEGDALAFDAVLALADGFEEKIGSYPPRWDGPDDRTATYQSWSRAILAVEQLKAAEGDTERLVVLHSRLLRQGHNMDVRDCGRQAADVIEAGLRTFPDSIPVNFQASYFYLQIDPRYAPEGEKALLRLRRLLATDRNLEVERGFVFAYLYQNKIKDAKRQVDRCLKLAPGDKMLLALREGLKSGRVQRHGS